MIVGGREEIMTTSDVATPSLAMPGNTESKASSSTDVSTTNIQIAGVDEPDILKTNKDTYIYADAKHNKIYLVNSPLDRNNSTVNLSNTKITSTILLPKQMQ